MTIVFQTANAGHALGMSQLLHAILQRWDSPRPYSVDHILAHYIEHRDSLMCTVALDQERVVGFQSLRLAVENNEYGVTPGWGIIGSYVAEGMGGRGIGRGLFQQTLTAAKAAKIPAIDATIADRNDEGQAYYGAMGFQVYQTRPGAICRKFTL
ncbi:MAG: GNAT family N-acetyltransferase [Pelagimonas sp.]|uniref:GNAT family N-acetyltransferase n=1 Tax=Pelagimonas sp. TaxID=2073170 RepID=UPI003D6C30F3